MKPKKLGKNGSKKENRRFMPTCFGFAFCDAMSSAFEGVGNEKKLENSTKTDQPICKNNKNNDGNKPSTTTMSRGNNNEQQREDPVSKARYSSFQHWQDSEEKTPKGRIFSVSFLDYSNLCKVKTIWKIKKEMKPSPWITTKERE
ncbi:unnamed protein product [Dovyalis caffra]|uniref:Uncharacterized protein n=1 Tax=Dovyalis caffra TaxID=77055 RepID=A0AAV1SWJ6_9ROSI|nr:unnamed protein product [Dovyalis caffra]